MRHRILAGFFALCLILSACGQSAEAAWQEQYDLGVKYLDEGSYEEAVIAFTAAIDIDEKRPEAYIGRGDAYALSGDTEDNLSAAQADYEEAIALDETLPEAWLGLADVYIRRGEYDRALEILREALEKTGGDQSISDKLAEVESGSFSDSSGNVRRMNLYDGVGKLICYHTFTYNEQGWQSSVTSFDADGTETSHVDLEYDTIGNQTVGYWPNLDRVMPQYNTYDEAGNVTRQVWAADGVAGVPSYTYLYYYDGDGRVIRSEQYEEDELVLYHIYEWDGNFETRYTFDSRENLRGHCISEYLEKGKPLKYSYYNAEGILQESLVYEYADDGTLIRIYSYDADGNLTWSEHYN